MQKLGQRVLQYIRRGKLLRAGDRVGVAVSGGADSVALLRLLLQLQKELGVVLSVVHFNHKLRGADSDADQEFVAGLARDHALELHSGSGDVAAYAAEKRLSLEAAARELRYEYFVQLLAGKKMNRLATAHTLDDQAETVLQRIVRGAGTRGMAGIYPQFSLSHQSSVASRPDCSIVRPLLATRRKDLEAYLTRLGQSWREDASNRDLRFERNRVRHEILPCLESSLNPAVRETLAETAEIARAEEAYWEKEVAGLLPRLWQKHTLKLQELADLPLALQRRVVRAVAESLGLRLEFRHVEEVLELVAGSAKSAVLPEGWTASRRKNELRFEHAATVEAAAGYEYCLPVPGEVKVPELRARFEAVLVSRSAEREYNPHHLFDPGLLTQELRVRNWRAGDRFWPAHTKSPKKIKELLQERHVTGLERKLWPVVVSGAEIVWVRGFPLPVKLRATDRNERAVAIREVPLVLRTHE